MRFSRLLIAVVLLVAPTAGCTSGDSPDPEPAATAEVIVPGRPGEPAQTLPDGPAGTVEQDGHSPADVRFLQDMVVHHRQAVTMAAMAPDRAGDERVRVLAERIALAQEPEVEVMAARLKDWKEPVPPVDEHADHSAHSDMPGMATPAQLAELRESTGQAFDRLFLQLMSAHHQGALTMADTVLRSGSDERVGELATDIAVVQTKEISQMQAILAEL